MWFQQKNIIKKLEKKILPSLLKKIKTIINFAAEKNIPCYFVGGVVRDLFLNKKINDVDIVFEGISYPAVNSIAKRLNAELIYHPGFLTYTLKFNDCHIDLVTTRKESYFKCGALPTVTAADIKTDIFRRDFTINSIAISLNNFRLIDFANGLEDLKKGIIKVFHDKSFYDDPTRILRAFRFLVCYNLKLSAMTRILLKKAIDNEYLKFVSPARIGKEILKIFQQKESLKILKVLQKNKVIKQLFLQDFIPTERNKKINLSNNTLTIVNIIDSSYGFKDRDLFFNQLKKFCIPSNFYLKAKEIVDFLDASTPPSISKIKKIGKYFNLLKYYIEKEKIKRLKNYLNIHLNGNILKEMGITDGILIGKILNEVRKERFLGRLKSKKDEINFVRKKWVKK